jgi:dipeptide/tripeptide permease
MIFRHLDATLPKYMMREFGDDVPKGTIYSINPVLIIVLVPLVSAATTNVDPLVMIHIGSYVSAVSVFALVASTSIGACVLFVTLLSVGEALWSPRLYDYTMSICPEGREGTYMALSNAPLFLAKLPVGMLSGILLQTYCPSEGERHSQTMWLIIGMMTISSPILMTVCWNYISQRESKDPISYTELPQRNTNVI